MSYNFPEEVWINGNKLVTTRMEIPVWSTSDALHHVFKKPIVQLSGFKVTYKYKDFTDVVADMIAVDWIDKKYQHIDTDKILPIVQEDIPVDGKEILEWMQKSFSGNAAISVMQAQMIDLNGFAEGASDDGYIPGVSVCDISYEKEPSNVITNRGYAKLKSPYGIDRVPIIDKLTVIKDKMLAWAAIPWTGLKQWAGALIKWLKLPVSGFRNAHLPNVKIGGLSSPQFLAHIPPRFGLKNVVYMSVASDKDQRLVMMYRNPRNFTEEWFRLTLPLRANSVARIKFKIRSLFGVPPMLVHFETPDNGCIDIQQYEVKSSLIPF